MHREHPLRIIRYSTKNLWLLIFPLLRGAYHFTSQEDFIDWLNGTWLDLLILLAIFGYGFLDWYFREFTVANGQIFVQEGILYTRKRFLPIRNLSALTVEHPFWLRAIGGAYVNADTASGILEATDIKLMIRQKDEILFLSALPKIQTGERCHFGHHGSFWRVLLFSVIFSSSFSGAVYTAVFWFQSGRIARDLLEQFQVTEQISTISEEVASKLIGIPPAAVTIGIIILFLWMLSFISNVLRYGGFSMESDTRLLKVKSGLLTRRMFLLVNRKINFVDIRQNLLTKFFRIYSLAVNCPGYGNQRGSIPICLPILTKKELDETLPMIFPGIRVTRPSLRARWTAWWGYVCWEVIAAAAVIPAAMLAKDFFPRFADIIGFLQIMLEIPIFWKFMVQIAALITTGVSVTDGRICVKYCKGMTFHTLIADTDCLVKVKVNRHVWQRWFGTCHVILYFQSEVTRNCTLLTLRYADVLEMFGDYLTV